LSVRPAARLQQLNAPEIRDCIAMAGSSKSNVSGIVLAGGRSRRMGRDKALEPLGGQSLIRRVIERISPVVGEIVVVAADRSRGESLPLARGDRVALDVYPGCGSLGGIFSGLSAAREDWGLVVACDMPFLNPKLLRYLLGLRQGFDAVVPVRKGRFEPTHALYARTCLPHIERRLRTKDLKISGFFEDVRVKYVPDEDLARVDPEFLSFFNLNTPADLELARALVTGSRKGKAPEPRPIPRPHRPRR
jgi:molybdopterin-guanine dinucleotide biosynthesis protein A